jgi:hypothetical protein
MLNFASSREFLQRLIHPIQGWLDNIFRWPAAQGLMRFGHGAKGMLYGLIGLFVVNDLIHDQPVVSGSQGVLTSLVRQPLGSIMLGLFSVGLLGYVLWRFIQAGLDPGHTSDISPRRVVQRLGYAISGFTYLGLAYAAGRLALGLAVDFDDTVEDLAAVLFEREIGPWVLLGVGFSVIVVGLTYIYGAYTGSYISDLSQDLYKSARRWAVNIGKVGIVARGVGFILIGAYLVKAGYTVDADQAGDLGNVFDQLDDQPLGEVWLAAISFGFIAYATYMIVAAFYRKFPSSKSKNR